jgi:hypothetical protein
MPKRRTAGRVQRRSRASGEALQRRLGEGGGLPIDPRLLALGGFLLLGLMVVLVAFTFGRGPDPHFGQVIPDDGRSHVADGTVFDEATARQAYSSRPGVSGPHWNTPAQWGVYGPDQDGFRSQPVPEQQVIHNLEHAGIVIWYQPHLADEQEVSRVADWVRGQLRTQRFKVILSPWPGEDFGHAWAVTAWRHLLYLDGGDLGAIRSFIDTHYGVRGPEPQGGPGPPADQ